MHLETVGISKFYVNCGLISTIVAKNSPQEAAIFAMKRHFNNGGIATDCGSIVEVNQSGSEVNTNDGVFFFAKTIMRLAEIEET